ncbi:hypothetical protein LX73_1756 [Fodinibius salinus]|uniref:6-bladed beta-propeller protein n=1 Tax=Fodinibius salinus TaxID=860790 RepID=A0A5D3YJL1_9BACT|nr:hypothetical protein [Fodinibius salinus]TYP94034.1 hypothetical protein LX73_1756 [Fodinibius salinus]
MNPKQFMTIRNFLYISLVFLITSCSSSTGEQKINYTDLKKVDFKTTLEIGESEQFLPGRLRDLFVNSEGDIIVSDGASTSISQFDSEGNFVATVAQKGGGPGELAQYFSMQSFRSDTLLVTNQQSAQKKYFAQGNNGVYQFVRSTVTEDNKEKNAEILAQKSDSTYYARINNWLTNIQDATKNANEYKKTRLVTTNLEGDIVTDSLLLLKEGTYHFTKDNKMIRAYRVPYRYNDHFTMLEDGSFLVARPDSSALFVYDQNQRLKNRIPLPIKKRPVRDDDLDYALDHVDRKIRSNIEARVSEYKPLYLDVWATQDHIWLKTDETKKDNLNKL